MCIFCASGPVVLAAGAGMQARQRKERKEAEAQGKKPKKPVAPAIPTTAIIFVGLFMASALVHANHWDF